MSTLNEVISEAEHDPETREHGATIWYHDRLGRYVYFCDYRLKTDGLVKRILPSLLNGVE